MGEFKNQFNQVFDQAPSFSKQARLTVKRKIAKKKSNRKWQGLIVIAIAAVVISAIIFNEQLFDRLNTEKTANINYALEHGDLKQEVISDILMEGDSQVVVNNTYTALVSMDRGNDEYVGELVIETNFDDIKYGQVVFVEEEVVDNIYRYELARVIGKPGDKVKIEEGQIYLNNAPIAAFYGKAHSADILNEDEDNERIKLIIQKTNDRIRKAIMISMDEVTVKNGELFIVSDNWTSDSIRKVINETAVEGVVLGYKHERDETENWRALTEEEFTMVKLVSEQVLAAFEEKDIDALRNLISEKIKIDEKRGEFYDSIVESFDDWNDDPHKYKEKIEKQPVTNEIGESAFSYQKYITMINEIKFRKSAIMSFKYKDKDGYETLTFDLENGEWKFSGFMY